MMHCQRAKSSVCSIGGTLFESEKLHAHRGIGHARITLYGVPSMHVKNTYKCYDTCINCDADLLAWLSRQKF